MYTYVCVCVHVCGWPWRTKGGIGFPRAGLNRWVWAIMWLLEIELRSSGKIVSALNHWAISLAPRFILLLIILQQRVTVKTPLVVPPVPAQQLTDVAQSLFHAVSMQGSIPANPPHHGSGELPPGIRTPVEWPVFPCSVCWPLRNQIVASLVTKLQSITSRQKERKVSEPVCSFSGFTLQFLFWFVWLVFFGHV